MEDKPMTMKLYRFVSNENVHKHMKEDKNSQYMERLLRGDVYLSSFHALNDPMEGAFAYELENNNNNFSLKEITSEISKYRICCFTKSYRNFLLWSYYANGHKGVCFEYEVDQNALNTEKTFISPVNYSSSLHNFIPFLTAESQALQIIMTKLAFWKHENEMRLISRRHNDLDAVNDNMINVGKLTKIIFGMKFDKYDGKNKEFVNGIMRREECTKLYKANINDARAMIGIEEVDVNYLR